jgi:hypothetical protein
MEIDTKNLIMIQNFRRIKTTNAELSIKIINLFTYLKLMDAMCTLCVEIGVKPGITQNAVH